MQLKNVETPSPNLRAIENVETPSHNLGAIKNFETSSHNLRADKWEMPNEKILQMIHVNVM